jgi:DHA1 family tetracycline resistance protein-like MFS transporter
LALRRRAATGLLNRRAARYVWIGMGILFFIVFIDLIGFGIMIPLQPYYGLHFHASPAEVTWLMACYSLAQFVSSPLLGRLSDRIGRRPVLIASLVCSALSYVWMGQSDALWMLFAARLFAGAGAGNIAAAQAYIADVTPPEGRAKGMGMIGAAFGLGFTVGPWIGGVLAGDHPAAADLARPAYLAAGLSAVALLLTLFVLKESRGADARAATPRSSRLDMARAAFSRPVLRRLILLTLAGIAAFAAMETTFALWANAKFGWGPEKIGELFFYVGLELALVQGVLIGPLTRRCGEGWLVVAGAGFIAFGLLSLPFAGSLPVVLVVNGLLALGMGLFNPALTSLVSRQAAADERGGIIGVSQSASSLARILGPVIAGPVFEAFGRNAPYYLAGAVMVLVALAALPLTSRALALEAPLPGEARSS